MDLLLLTAIFILVALASKKIGEWFSQIGLPYITGYLFAGALAGPFILDILPESAPTTLRYIDQLALGIIAFVAGSELYLKEIRNRINTIAWITGGVILLALPIGIVSLFLLTNFLPFADDMSTLERMAIALLGGTILLALSPPSTIAVIKEVRAKGSFSRTILGVTVTMDVVIIVLFAVVMAIASTLLVGESLNISFLLLLLLDLGLALGLGYATGRLLEWFVGLTIDIRFKMGGVLVLGYVIFAAGAFIKQYTGQNFPIEIYIEPLLIALFAGFYVTNFTAHRETFAEILHDVGPMVYVAFFTLTGVTIKLDILMQTWPIAVALFATRSLGIFLGSTLGVMGAKETKQMRNNAWLGLITQAGIALGLAREVATSFPNLGDAFATMVISVVVLNEIFGPMLLKFALNRAGESNLPQEGGRAEQRDALILGVEPQSITLARQLQKVGWDVILADTNQEHVERLAAADVDERYIPSCESDCLSGLINQNTDAILIMLEDDEQNLAAAEYAYHKRIPRIIVRPQDLSLTPKFVEMGALILDPNSAMINLMEQSVRAPQTTAVLLHQDAMRGVVQVTVSNRSIDGMLVRDLRLPDSVLLLEVTRDDASLIPHGYTRLRLRDEITLIGDQDGLDEATFRLGF